MLAVLAAEPSPKFHEYEAIDSPLGTLDPVGLNVAVWFDTVSVNPAVGGT